jgi:hypothetical protein
MSNQQLTPLMTRASSEVGRATAKLCLNVE